LNINVLGQQETRDSELKKFLEGSEIDISRETYCLCVVGKLSISAVTMRTLGVVVIVEGGIWGREKQRASEGTIYTRMLGWG
jgi:hypothetical protein